MFQVRIWLVVGWLNFVSVSCNWFSVVLIFGSLVGRVVVVFSIVLFRKLYILMICFVLGFVVIRGKV